MMHISSRELREIAKLSSRIDEMYAALEDLAPIECRLVVRDQTVTVPVDVARGYVLDEIEILTKLLLDKYNIIYKACD